MCVCHHSTHGIETVVKRWYDVDMTVHSSFSGPFLQRPFFVRMISLPVVMGFLNFVLQHTLHLHCLFVKMLVSRKQM